ncbi:uncharacterized protein LOC141902221 [Tubulanus polymorphus]|uniref:uncharacterized protein LOC141902221 n=1 Tax=Tubulanus polymorphus TaxID=672921 RepID=UPI003DA640D3
MPSKEEIMRNAQIRQMTKLFDQARKLLHSESDESLDKLSGVITRIRTKLEVIAGYDSELIANAELGKLEDLVCETDDYMNEINIELSTFIGYLERKKNQIEPTTRMKSEQQKTAKRPIQLPKLSLPTFDGDILKWQTFFDGFFSAVDSDENLTNIQKFQYLSAQLKGDAAKTIENLSLTNENYNQALELLLNRYGTPHKIVAAYMKALWELSPPSDRDNSLRNFYDSLESYIRGLNSLGKSEESYGDLLVPIIMEKLPSGTKQQITRDHGNNAWSLTDLRKSLLNEIEAFEASIESLTIEDDFPTNSPTVGAFAVTAKNRHNFSRENDRKCAFCKKINHVAVDCKTFPDAEKRREIVARDNLCFNCLSSGHKSTKCLSKNRCRVTNCGKKHHTSVHLDAKSTTPVAAKSTDEKADRD